MQRLLADPHEHNSSTRNKRLRRDGHAVRTAIETATTLMDMEPGEAIGWIEGAEEEIAGHLTIGRARQGILPYWPQ